MLRNLKLLQNRQKVLNQKNHNYPSAIKVFKKAIYLRPDLSHLKLSLLSCKAFSCDWSEPKYVKDTLNKIDDLEQEICPFDLLYLEDNPSNNLKRARHFFESKYKRVSQNISYTPKKKIRVGYFSADFRKHAVMYLIKGLFEMHNKEQFDVYAYSLISEEDELTGELKKNIAEGRDLDEILPESFALVREAAKQALNERHFDVQLIGGIALHENKIAEMKTGEGKTLTIVLAAYLNALEKKGVHIVTVNDYLAKRDSLNMGKIYNFLGLECGYTVSYTHLTLPTKRKV